MSTAMLTVHPVIAGLLGAWVMVGTLTVIVAEWWERKAGDDD